MELNLYGHLYNGRSKACCKMNLIIFSEHLHFHYFRVCWNMLGCAHLQKNPSLFPFFTNMEMESGDA